MHIIMERTDSQAEMGRTVTGLPRTGQVFTVILTLLTIMVLTICLTKRVPKIVKWKGVPLTFWLVLAIYTDSLMFVLTTAVVRFGFNINSSDMLCNLAILFCLCFYLSSKLMIYLYFTERSYIVRGVYHNRLRDGLYVFNIIVIIGAYLVIIVLQFKFKINYINLKGSCIIGMERKVLIPLISYEVLINVYLTALFVYPLRQLYSYKHNANPHLRTVALRCLAGTCTTLTTSGVNLTVLTVLDGEPGWICLMCCNIDILFSVLVLHWVTAQEPRGRQDSTRGSRQAPESCVQQKTEGTTEPNSSSSIDEQYFAQAGVITSITSGEASGGREILYIPERITVQTEQSQKFESRKSEDIEKL